MDSLEFFQVMSMFLSDRPLKWSGLSLDALFFHARSFNGDEDGLFELVAEWALAVEFVAINGSENGEGVEPGVKAWPGAKYYKKRLRPIARTFQMRGVVLTRPALHTYDEGEAFSELAQERGWKNAIVIAQPFQLLRIMLTNLKVMQKRNYPMRIYAVAPQSVDWNKVTNGNQGRASVSRFDQIKMEFERVPLYQKQNNLATIPELIEYLLRGRSCI